MTDGIEIEVRGQLHEGAVLLLMEEMLQDAAADGGAHTGADEADGTESLEIEGERHVAGEGVCQYHVEQGIAVAAQEEGQAEHPQFGGGVNKEIEHHHVGGERRETERCHPFGSPVALRQHDER